MALITSTLPPSKREFRQPNLRISGYLLEKENMGLITQVHLSWSNTALQDTPSIHACGSHQFYATEKYYAQILCPELARMVCEEGLSPMVRRVSSFREFTAHYTLNCYRPRYYVSSLADLPGMIEFMLNVRDVMWEPPEGDYGVG